MRRNADDEQGARKRILEVMALEDAAPWGGRVA
jgi:hypothetical protein